MIYVMMIFLLIMIIISIYMEKKFWNPITLFSGIWLLTIFLANLKLYNMIDYSEKALWIISEGVIFFILGAWLSRFYWKRINIMKTVEREEFYNKKLLYIIVSIGLIMVTILSIKVFIQLKNGMRYTDIRKLYYSYGDGSLIGSEQLFTLFDWGTAAIIALIIPTVIIGIINKKISKLLIVESILMIGLYIFSTSGRAPLFIIAIELILAVFINKKNLTSKVKKVLRIGIIIMLIAILCMTAIRASNNYNQKVNSFYAYFSLPLPYFSRLIEYVDKQDINTYGVATAYGPYLMVQKVVKLATGYKFSNAEELDEIVTKPQTYWVKIFDDSLDYYNAYSTAFYPFYLDFRQFGVAIFSLIYGFLVEKFYINAIYRKSIKSYIRYLMIVVGMIQSFAVWQFASPTILVALFLTKFTIKEREYNES